MAEANVNQEGLEDLFEEVNGLFLAGDYDRASLLLLNLLEGVPDHPRALHALGAIACQRGDIEEASNYVKRALEIDPEYANACNTMGNILKADEKGAEARTWYKRALELDPDLAVAHYNIGLLDLNSGDLENAALSFDKSIALRPDYIQAIFYLGDARMKMGEFANALANFERVIGLDPSMAQAWAVAADLHRKYKRCVEAEECCRKGLENIPDHPVLLNVLGTVLLEQGRISEAEECHRRVLSLDDTDSDAYSCLMYAMNYDPHATQEDIHSLAVKWDHKCCRAIKRFTSFTNSADPERPLRIGYISADLLCHPVGFHLLPVMRNHDRSAYRIYCYFNSFTGDEMTREFIDLSDGWKIIAHLNDRDAADLIRSEGIDILVDLSGHSAMHRMQLFARKPAPVQASWLGYFTTTGLSTIDYLITDDATVLQGEDKWFSEKVVRLPWSRFCFTPYAYLPDVVSPPCLVKGHVTFGSFNNLAKVNRQVVALWSRILRNIPGSRLILKRGELENPRVREYFTSLFAAEKIESDRLDLRESSDYATMLSEYGEVDIALDPFPFSGGLTSLDAFLMGVPVVTRSGKLPISRQTRAFLRVINLLELVARSEEQYYEIVTNLASDPGRLEKIRRDLRGRLMNSYLCNGKEFTRNLENAYRTMWRDWCISGKAKKGRKVREDD